MIELFDIHSYLKGIIEVPESLVFESYVSNGDGTGVLTVQCTTKYARAGKKLYIDGVEYFIVSINRLEITIKGVDLTDEPTLIQLETPYYYHGTVKQTNCERVSIPDSADKTPFVYVNELLKEKYSNDLESSELGDFDLRMFFLDESDFEQYQTNDYYENVIYPMRSLAETILNRLEDNIKTMSVDNIDVVNYTRFATFIDSKGYEKNLFAETLSGVEARFSLKIKKIKSCKC